MHTPRLGRKYPDPIPHIEDLEIPQRIEKALRLDGESEVWYLGERIAAATEITRRSLAQMLKSGRVMRRNNPDLPRSPMVYRLTHLCESAERKIA